MKNDKINENATTPNNLGPDEQFFLGIDSDYRNNFKGTFLDREVLENDEKPNLNHLTKDLDGELAMTTEELKDISALWDDDINENMGLGGTIDAAALDLAAPRKPIEKDTRKLVTDVSRVPFRWICSIKTYFRDPDDPGTVVEFDGGTGLLISPNHVLTAAHIVYAEVTGSKGTRLKQKAIKSKVYPGRKGNNSFTFGSANSHSYAYHKKFEKDLDVRWDYAVIKLKEKIGLKKFKRLQGQTLGYWGSSKWGQKTFIKALSKSYLKTQILNVGGYPKNKGGRQYLAFDRVKDVPPTIRGKSIPELITYLVDTGDGQSGSPVWKYVKETGKRYLVAVHRGVCHHNLDGCKKAGKATSNLGVLMTPEVIAQIGTWIKAM